MPAIKDCIIKEIRSRFNLDQRFTEDLIDMNLPYLFALNDQSALMWLNWIEECYQIRISSTDINTDFFSSVERMKDIVEKHLNHSK